ncbi:MAG: NAD(P)/FAD-dependent oxidoreductase [Ewingella sp.]
MKLESFWQATAPVFSGAAGGDLPKKAEVVVVGGGFTGLSAAYNLALAGVDVVVLEAGDVLSQASGRNGGQCNTGVAQNFASLVESIGLEQASIYYHAYTEAVDYVQSIVKDEAIECDLIRSGKLKLASKARHFPSLVKTYELLRRTVDSNVELINASQIRDEIGSDAFHGGLLQKNGGQMHMGKFGMGLAQAAVDKGAVIHANTPVTGLQQIDGHRYRVSTARGEIDAGRVLLATGTSDKGPFSWFQRRIVPVGSFIIATAPLTSEQVQQAFVHNRTYVTSLNIGNYFRTTVDNRLIFGGRARFAISSPTSDARSGIVLRQGLSELFPQLADVNIDYCWGGLVDMTADRLPHAGEHEGLFYSMGYSGHGTQMSVYMGKVMAALVTDQPVSNPWRRSHWAAMPGYFGKPWFLPVAGLYYKAKDKVC